MNTLSKTVSNNNYPTLLNTGGADQILSKHLRNLSQQNLGHPQFQPTAQPYIQSGVNDVLADFTRLKVTDWNTKLGCTLPPSQSTQILKPSPHSKEPQADVRRLAGALALGAVEVLMGLRNIGQMERWLSPDLYQALWKRARLFELTAPLPHRRKLPTCVKQVHVKTVISDAYTVAPREVVATIFDGQRIRAVALRLEEWRGEWRATALEIG